MPAQEGEVENINRSMNRAARALKDAGFHIARFSDSGGLEGIKSYIGTAPKSGDVEVGFLPRMSYVY